MPTATSSCARPRPARTRRYPAGAGHGRGRAGAPGLGDRLLVRFEIAENGEREARLIKRLGQSAHRILGVVRKARRRDPRRAGRPRARKDSLLLADADGARPERRRPGAGPDRRRRRRAATAPSAARCWRWSAARTIPRAASLIAIHAHGIPTGFSPTPPRRKPRPPSRRRCTAAPTCATLPLVTIDPPDARDHDDAVFAEPDDDRAQSRRLDRLGGHRRRRRLRPPRLGARPRGAREGQQRLLPRPGRADAARARSPPASARCAKASRAPAWPCGWCSTPTAASAATASSAA